MGLVTFRSLEDGTVASTSRAFVRSARHYAPDLIDDNEASAELPVYQALSLHGDVAPREDDDFWGRLDASIERGIYIPGKHVLLVDISFETDDFVPEHFVGMHRQLRQRQIPLDTVAMVTLCRNLPNLYEAWAIAQNVDPRVTIYSYWGIAYQIADFIDRTCYGNEQLFRAKVAEASDQLYALRPRERRFLCLNNMRKPHRLSMAMLLWERFPTESLVSFGRIEPEEVPEFTRLVEPWAPDGAGSLEDRVRAFAATTPLILDVETGSAERRERAEFTISPELYRRSAISIVTDTWMSSLDQLCITEKPIKPMALFQPFVLAGDCGALQALRDEGYRTFRPFIDESYDEIRDGQERIRAVQREVLRLGALSEAEFLRGLRSIAENIVHNACQLRYMRAHDLRGEVNHILQRMRRVFGPRLGYADPITATAAPEPDWAEIAPIVVDDFAEIRLDWTGCRLQLTRRSAFDETVRLFIHTHVPSDPEPWVAQTIYWRPGERSSVIDLPRGDIRRVVLGQFITIDDRYHNIWQTTIDPEISEPSARGADSVEYGEGNE